jgi:hypothetical protein
MQLLVNVMPDISHWSDPLTEKIPKCSGSAHSKALCYKPEGRVFVTQ